MSKRVRHWAFLVYPESALPGWIDELKSQGLQGFISPLHEPDEEGRKPHYHVLLKFKGVKSLEQVKAISASVKGTEYVKPVQSWEGYVRYLCHLDQPEKQQWPDTSGVVPLGGLDYDAETMTPDDDIASEVAQLRVMMDAVADAGLMDWRAMIEWCQTTGREDWIAWLYERPTATSWIRDTLKSAYHQWQRQQETLHLGRSNPILGTTTQNRDH